MSVRLPLIKPALAAAAIVFASALAASPRLDALYAQLQEANTAQTPFVVEKIRDLLGQSGSAAVDLLIARGQAALAEDDMAAIGHFTAAIDHAPEFAHAYTLRAEAYLAAELWGPAIADLEVALALEPRDFDAIMALAFIFESLERKDEALALWERIAALMPGAPDPGEARARMAGPGGTEA